MKNRHNLSDGIQLGCFFPNGRTGAVFSDELAERNPEISAQSMLGLAQACERNDLDFVLIADGWTGLDKLSESHSHASPMFNSPLLGAAISATTEHIGIITTMHTDIHHPVHVARIGGSLNTLSDGRWGWNIVTDQPNQAALFGQEPNAHDERYEIAEELTEVVKRLWSEQSLLTHEGKHYATHGRIKAPRPVQDSGPLLVNAAASAAGMAFAAKYCDALMTSAPSREQTREMRGRLDELLEEQGRAAAEMSLLVTAKCLIRDTEAEAQAEWERIRSRINLDVCLDQMQTMYSGDAAMPARLADVGMQEDCFAGVEWELYEDVPRISGVGGMAGV